MSKPEATQLAADAVAQAGAAALPTTCISSPPPGNNAEIAPPTAAAAAGPADPTILSEDERALLEYLIRNDRNQNFYRYGGEDPPYYYGWFYLTNLLWYIRTTFNKSGERLTPDRMASLQKDYGAKRNARVPANPTKQDPEIPRLGPPGPPPEWFGLLFGGIIPFAQSVLARIRRPYFEDITLAKGQYQSSSPIRTYHAKDHGDPARDAAADSRRLELLATAVKYLGTEYQQKHPETKQGREFGRKLTLDCSGFTARVYAELKVLVDERTKAVIDLGSRVSDQYFKTISYPETLRVVMGPRCTLLAGAPRRGSGAPPIEPTIEDVPFDGTVLTGDLGLTRMRKRPYRKGDGTVDSDFGHVVMFTGRKVGNQYECIHASNYGECVDFGARAISDVGVLIRPKV